MSELILPTIGSKGYFELRTPLDQLIVQNEQYTCQAIRRLSDYLAANETPATDVYATINLPDTEYQQDLLDDSYIVSLQSEQGHWLYIPARYILTYPITNGIPYRSIMIGVSLPSLPADRDISFLTTDISNLVTDALGVASVTKLVETSRVMLVARDRHDTMQAARNLVASGRITDRSRYISLLTDHQLALDKIAILEQYIKTNYVP